MMGGESLTFYTFPGKAYLVRATWTNLIKLCSLLLCLIFLLEKNPDSTTLKILVFMKGVSCFASICVVIPTCFWVFDCDSDEEFAIYLRIITVSHSTWNWG